MIKNVSIGNYEWNSDGGNWRTSDLNTYRLNEWFLTNLGNLWNEKIKVYNWNTSSVSSSNTMISKDFYETENSGSTTYSAKIGLMYVSDYGFAASPTAWNTPLYANGYNDSNITSNNWLYLGVNEWMISMEYKYSQYYPYYIVNNGYILANEFSYSNYRAVRPTFYLNADVQYSSGTGTAVDPYRIGI